MERATFSLTGNDLLNTLTINALDLFYVIGNPDDSEVSMLESAISLVAEAWDLPQEVLAKSKMLIAAEREATRCEAQGEPAPQPTEEKIPEHHADCTPISVLWGLLKQPPAWIRRTSKSKFSTAPDFWPNTWAWKNGSPIPAARLHKRMDILLPNMVSPEKSGLTLSSGGDSPPLPPVRPRVGFCGAGGRVYP